jgi:fumarate hydratase subunit alpha
MSIGHPIREINVTELGSQIAGALSEAAMHLPSDYLEALQAAQHNEETELARDIIGMLLENAEYAANEQIPTCQDTGMAILNIEIGQDVHFVGGDLYPALESAVRQAYRTLRKSVVSDPLLRVNTRDNTPPLIHYELVSGSQVKVTALMKGFGAELMSGLQMFPPSVGVAGVKQYVLEIVGRAGPNACPPMIVGVGLGSSFDGVAYLAKKALMRPLGQANPVSHLAQLEQELLTAINRLGVGPQGFGGKSTALAVHIESQPTHIAALPVAVNLNCSAPRRTTITY